MTDGSGPKSSATPYSPIRQTSYPVGVPWRCASKLSPKHRSTVYVPTIRVAFSVARERQDRPEPTSHTKDMAEQTLGRPHPLDSYLRSYPSTDPRPHQGTRLRYRLDWSLSNLRVMMVPGPCYEFLAALNTSTIVTKPNSCNHTWSHSGAAHIPRPGRRTACNATGGQRSTYAPAGCPGQRGRPRGDRRHCLSGVRHRLGAGLTLNYRRMRRVPRILPRIWPYRLPSVSSRSSHVTSEPCHSRMVVARVEM